MSHDRQVWQCGNSRGRIGLLAATLASTLLLSGTAMALELAHGDLITLAEGRVVDGDWYAAGNRVDVNGRVARSALIAARHAEVQGAIGQDLNVAVETAAVRAPVRGSVRAACRQLHMASSVSEDAVIFAQEAVLEKGAAVGKDLLAACQGIRIEGSVQGRTWLAAETVELNGIVSGEVRIKANRVSVGPLARIQGPLVYEAPEAMRVSPGAQLPPQVQWQRTRPESGWKNFLLGWLLFRLGMILALLLAGIVLVALAPAATRRYTMVIQDHALPCLGWGTLTLLAVPTAAIILAVTLVGIPIAVVLVMLFILATLVGQMAIGYLVGIRIYGEKSLQHPILAYVVGFLIFAGVGLIPILGWLARCAATLLGLGAWWMLRKQKPEIVKPAA